MTVPAGDGGLAGGAHGHGQGSGGGGPAAGGEPGGGLAAGGEPGGGFAAGGEVAVLIVGGGPVGLAARVLLERWGVRALLVEKRRGLSPFPRSRLVNVRSMEILRGLGLADRVTAEAFAPEYGRIRFRDTLRGPEFATAAMVGIDARVPESPARGVVTSQDRLEPVLLAAADAPVRFGLELVGLSEDPGGDGVVATLADRGSGKETRVRARYVVAADGAHSTVRQLLGIGTAGPGAMGSFTTVVFDADLDRWCADRPAGVYFTAHGSFAPVHPEGGWIWFGLTPDDPAGTDWPAAVARALGPGDDVPVDVVRVQHWVMNAFVAERLHHGRILLTGDAAHAVPITGGLGMNTGLADVHNLCWKLAGVLHGWAGPHLLDTYAEERLPVAHRTLRRAVENTQLMLNVQHRRRAQLRSGAEPTPVAAATDRLSAPVELPWSERYFAQLGLVLGVAYGAADTPSDGATDYVPTAEPGHRLPHLWLTPEGPGPDGTGSDATGSGTTGSDATGPGTTGSGATGPGGAPPGRSTLDACGEWFTLLTPGPDRGERLAAGPWPVRVEPLPAEHAARWGLGPRGALLVRPDGHIGARWHDLPRPGGTELRAALAALTRSTPPGGAP
ncbi:FAD-dependent monooxygenase [Streptomyces typhae]|uniref:FAD-dependent monooxygenase n=1 Tax=Streptomyces typhae TaxID=2681492 RepID=UPI001FE84166|nr:FAD-dependent monooxygenase [Streptomyces typhae]